MTQSHTISNPDILLSEIVIFELIGKILENMTAAELIKQLQILPPEIKVVIRGYEDGYNDILELRTVKIKPNKNAHWYDGEYEDSNSIDAIDSVNLYGENTNPVDNR